MEHTADYENFKYRPMILQYSEILQYHLRQIKTTIYGTLTAMILRSTIGLFYNETYGTILNYNEVDDDGDNDRNKYGNNNDNTASISGSDSPIFDPITMP